VSEERPSYVRTGAFKPCDCKKCFFCLQGHTNGNTYCSRKQAKVTVEYKCGMWVKTNKCTNVRLSLGLESGWYCGMCYRKQLTNELSAKERKKACISSQMGCLICKEYLQRVPERGLLWTCIILLKKPPTDHATQSPAVTWQPMAQLWTCKIDRQDIVEPFCTRDHVDQTTTGWVMYTRHKKRTKRVPRQERVKHPESLSVMRQKGESHELSNT